MAADASAYGLGVVLSHMQMDGSERPVAFASRVLTSSERNYAQVEKEAQALIFAAKFHQPLLSIFGPKKGIPPLAAGRLQHWVILLSAYTYDIEYKSSNRNANADGLSQLPLQESDCTSSVPASFNNEQIQALPVTSDGIRTATGRDPILSRVLLYTRKGWPGRVPDVLKPFLIRKQELIVEDGCILWGIRV